MEINMQTSQATREKVQAILAELFTVEMNSTTAAEMRAARYLNVMDKAGVRFIIDDGKSDG
jgi:hypothetical protein